MRQPTPEELQAQEYARRSKALAEAKGIEEARQAEIDRIGIEGVARIEEESKDRLDARRQAQRESWLELEREEKEAAEKARIVAIKSEQAQKVQKARRAQEARYHRRQLERRAAWLERKQEREQKQKTRDYMEAERATALDNAAEERPRREGEKAGRGNQRRRKEGASTSDNFGRDPRVPIEDEERESATMDWFQPQLTRRTTILPSERFYKTPQKA